jgi:nitroimidazol reductase NimA-like FMN-containing flavoprotein (pyridoxamine 5'-phosphate oxidase superfamily)
MVEMSPTQIEQVLEDSRIGRLCMADTDGRPYSVPLPFCWHDGALYLRLPLSGRKGSILRRNDRVCFEVDQFTDTLDDYCSVLIEGRLIPVTDLAEKQRVKQLNDAKYRRLRGGYRPGHGRATPLEELPMRKIAVEQLSGRARHPAPALARTG